MALTSVTNPFARLPHEMFLKICSDFSVSEIVKLGEISKYFSQRVNDPYLWQSIAGKYHIEIMERTMAKKEVFQTIEQRNRVAQKFLSHQDDKVWNKLKDRNGYYPFDTVCFGKNPFKQHDRYTNELKRHIYYAQEVLLLAIEDGDSDRAGYILKQGCFVAHVEPKVFLDAATIAISFFNKNPVFTMEALKSCWTEIKRRFSEKEIDQHMQKFRETDQFKNLFEIKAVANLLTGIGFISVGAIVKCLSWNKFFKEIAKEEYKELPLFKSDLSFFTNAVELLTHDEKQEIYEKTVLWNLSEFTESLCSNGFKPTQVQSKNKPF